MKRLACALATAALFVGASSLRADGLGTPVTGTLTFGGFGSTNYFDAANGFVPAGYGNSGGSTTVTIGPGIEFGFQDSANQDTADFDGTTLNITDNSFEGSSNSFQMTFTDPAFLGFSLLSDELGITYNFTGTTLTVDFAGGNVKGSDSVLFSYTSLDSAVPEPGTLGLLAVGLVGGAGILRRRFAN